MFYINAVLHIKNLCFAYASVSRTSKKNCASHDCSASHHCCLVSSLFEIRHAKHRWFTHAKKTFLHTSHIPLLNWRRPETCKTENSKQFHLPRKFPWENHAPCRSKKTFVWFWLFHATCKIMNMLRGPFVQHELRPKWPLPVLCYTHRLLSS